MPVIIIHQLIRTSDGMHFPARGKELIPVELIDEPVPEKERM
ncbi:MAG: hypothetical protein ACFFD4_34465 [Candidatus Odinarchaeota archaeon]